MIILKNFVNTRSVSIFFTNHKLAIFPETSYGCYSITAMGEAEEATEMKNMSDKKPEDTNFVENKVALASYGEIWHDIINFRSHFNKTDFFTGLVFGLGNN